MSFLPGRLTSVGRRLQLACGVGIHSGAVVPRLSLIFQLERTEALIFPDFISTFPSLNPTARPVGSSWPPYETAYEYRGFFERKNRIAFGSMRARMACRLFGGIDI